jgi:hypothetical protein
MQAYGKTAVSKDMACLHGQMAPYMKASGAAASLTAEGYTGGLMESLRRLVLSG